jgi:adenine specific DNA methylase Mod
MRSKNRVQSSPELTWKGKARCLIEAGSELPLKCSAIYSSKTTNDTFEVQGRLIQGDNLRIMQALLNEGLGSKIELIYIDPPFLSNADYYHKTDIGSKKLKQKAYGDKWSKEAYLNMLYPRFRLIKKLLTPTGKIFAHSDWRASPYIKLLMDEIFNSDNFLNEIIWSYGGRGAKATSNQFPRNHDTILAYGNSSNSRLKKVYSKKSLTLAEALRSDYRQDSKGRVFKTAPRGDYTDKSIAKLEAEGRIHKTRNGNIRIKYFLKPSGNKFLEEKLIGDVWDDIPDAMHLPLREKTGYATQKPEALLERIIECATEKGNIVCDLFSGSGTSAVVAGRLKRGWIALENSPIAINVIRKRLLANNLSHFKIEKPEEEKNKKSPTSSPAISTKDIVIKRLEDNRVEVTISIKGYEPLESRAGLVSELEMNSAEDKLILIDYIGIDWDFNGDIFCPTWHSYRLKNKNNKALIDLTAKALLTEAPKKINIHCVDIFGDEVIKILDL